ncbi:MAG: PKD domain-containing protein [Thermoplasmata archaeon]|nr:PKD domain-containing protein [Thermoplasmata archaeon]
MGFIILLISSNLSGFSVGSPVRADEPGSGSSPITEESDEIITIQFDGMKITKRRISASDVEERKNNIDSTGATLLTEEQWNDMIGQYEMIQITSETDLPASVDWSTSELFPKIDTYGQGASASCTAWAVVYYSFGYREAINRQWSMANEGKTTQLLNPGFSYNLANGGGNEGAYSKSQIADITMNWGCPTWSTMEFDQYDYTDWGNVEAWNEAPLHRIDHYDRISKDDNLVDNVKNMLFHNYLPTFDLVGNNLDSLLPSSPSPFQLDDNFVLSSNEYSETWGANYPHSQCIVGYDDDYDLSGDDEDGDDAGAFKIANSWGDDWGYEGFYWITYDCFESISSSVLEVIVPFEKPGYAPKLVASWSFDTGPRRYVNFKFTTESNDVIEEYSPTYRKTLQEYLPTYMSIDMTDYLLNPIQNKGKITLSIKEDGLPEFVFDNNHLTSLNVNYYDDGMAINYNEDDTSYFTTPTNTFTSPDCSPDCQLLLPEKATVWIDTEQPTSDINPVSYWHTQRPLEISASATAGISELKDVSLYYRYRYNIYWDWSIDWTLFNTKSDEPWTWDFPWTNGEVNSRQGLFQFYTIATDNAGNEEVAPTSPDYDLECGFDRLPPAIPSHVSPLNDADTIDNTPTIRWSKPRDDVSLIASYQLKVFRDNPLTTNYYTSTSESFTPDDTLDLGTWNWQVRAVDNAGNWGEWSSPWSFRIIPYPTEPVVVSGKVMQLTGDGISGATVNNEIIPCDISPDLPISRGTTPITSLVTTGSDGSYSITGLTIGNTYTLTASASGYASSSIGILVTLTGALQNFYLSSTSPTSTDPGDTVTCFIEGTKISTLEGTMRIESISEGDVVLSYNEVSGNIEPNRVIAIHSHPPSDYLLINDKLGVTEEHMIYVNNGLAPAGEIQVGDLLTGIERDEVVGKIEVISSPLEVYSIEVENNHNYYAEGVLVHNAKEPFIPGGGGCPFVYSWTGNEYVRDNNLLPQSTNKNRTELEVTDHYMLEQEMVPVNDTYSVRIYETGFEYTHLDQLQLVTIDHPDDYEVALTPDGEIITFTDTELVMEVYDNDGNDQVVNIDFENDGHMFTGIAGEYLTVNLGNMDEISDIDLLIRHSFIPPSNQAGWIEEITWVDKSSIHVQTQSETGDWVDLVSIPSRVDWSMCAIPLTEIMDYIHEEKDIRLYFTGEHSIDYIRCDITEQQQVEVNCYSPQQVRFIPSIQEDYSTKLLNSDGCYLKLAPGEGIEVEFPYIPSSYDCRDFIITTNGHYYTVSPIDIEQPVLVTASAISEGTGQVNIWVAENYDQETTHELYGCIVDIQNEEGYQFFFEQEVEKEYSLVVEFNNCDDDVKLTLVMASFRGEKSIELNYHPGDDTEWTLSLAEILWEVTGVDFNPITGSYVALKESLIQYKLNDFYNMTTGQWDEANWTFGDGVISNDVLPTHEYSDYGIYTVDLELMNYSANSMLITNVDIEVIPSSPIPEIEVYKEVDITLRTAGRKDNTVALLVYEDRELIDEMSVVRIPGDPDAQLSSLTLNKYIDRDYEFLLIFDAAHAGENPTRVTFESGDNVELFYTLFTTCEGGFHQEVSVDAVYLDNVLQGNSQYFFDASASYDLDGAIMSYEWDFGDGTVASGELVEHTFAETGTYEVELTIMDDDDVAASVTKVIQFQ